MARGLSREQLGITDALLATFGETVFRMSHNLQVREADPVRTLDWAEIERQREAMGLADGQIAARLGLTRGQVMFIRNFEESRRFRVGQQAYLLDLGGGKRYRPERVVRLEDRARYSEDALRLRGVFRFDAELARHYCEKGWWADDTVSGWLARHASKRPDAPAVIFSDQVITWKELEARVLRFAEGLRGAGVAAGEVVAVQLPNVPEFIVAFLAICRLGAVMTTLHMPYRGTEIQALLRHSRARVAICLAQAKDWSPPETFLTCLKTVVALGPRVDGCLAFNDLESGPPLSRDHAEPVAADPFLLLYTSGTTSAPKGVPHNYHTMLSNARLGVPEHRLGADDRILSAAPFSHLFGLYALHCAWACGASNVLLPAFTPPDLAATIEKHKPTALWTAPAHIAAVRAMGLLEKHDWSSLRLTIMSGSACPPQLVREFSGKLKACAVTQLWGMTETQGALYTRPGDPLETHCTSAGRPSPGTEVRVAEDGELQVRGCLLFPGFYDNDEANASAFTQDGWYRTGDLAAVDAGGNIAITGRVKDIINRGGVKFNPRDIEDLLDAHPKVLQSAIVPMPDAVLGEKACAFVTLRNPKQALTLEDLIDYLSDKDIARNKLPEKLVVVAEMPFTPTRKIIKGRLKIP
ncbi:MAG: class I adenylate-forming enzyme family protein [Proteobacteria bacterium]|nr:class I adenylate-forming enzyme family protein [Pseudomonadota bacterium]